MSDHTPDSIPMKRCSKGDDCCHPDGPMLPATPEYFSRDKYMSTGLTSACKACRRRGTKQYYENNKEKVKARKRTYYQENRDKERTRAQKYYWENHEKELDRHRKYRKENREIVNARSRQRYANDPEPHKMSVRKWRERNVELERERQRDAYWRDVKKSRAYYREWREKNGDRIRKREREYRRNNPQVAERQKRWREENIERVRERDRVRASNRRALKREAEGNYNKRDIKRIFEKQDGCCLYCGEALKKRGKNKFHIDHFIPLKRGGRNGPANIILSCPTCNLHKQSQLPYDWEDWNGNVPVEWDGRML